ncbi:MAG: DNA-binding protein [Opitutae bacterium]|nr:DNA-binding protein [Opitutae bacterium]
MSTSISTSPAQEFDARPGVALVPARVVALILGVSRSTVWRMAASGQLQPVRVGARSTRFRVADIRRIAGQE